MEAYARALRQLPTIIADNGGYDGSELISGLRAAHAKGQKASASSVFFFLFLSGSHSLESKKKMFAGGGYYIRCPPLTVLVTLQHKTPRVVRNVNTVRDRTFIWETLRSTLNSVPGTTALELLILPSKKHKILAQPDILISEGKFSRNGSLSYCCAANLSRDFLGARALLF